TFFVIPQLDWGISSNRRHCEGAKRPKQSRSKFRSNIVQGLINEIASVALLPRNDGDVMRSSGQARG
ncbi:MAG: hypothetical protein PUG59_05270, partial [Campylobacteraceae bacterium]|nr:hypothetical protein [Campylobacteraceae bacterium]